MKLGKTELTKGNVRHENIQNIAAALQNYQSGKWNLQRIFEKKKVIA